MNTLLTGYVTNILNEREVAINIGSSNGAQLGMRFEIRSKHAITVVDPLSGEELGEIDRVKVKVKVSDVHEKFSVARTYETFQINTGGAGVLFPDFSFFGKPPRIVTKVKTLRAEDYESPQEISPEESFVEVGDRVIQIQEDDENEDDE
jgi:hypothetical protein